VGAVAVPGALRVWFVLRPEYLLLVSFLLQLEMVVVAAVSRLLACLIQRACVRMVAVQQTRRCGGAGEYQSAEQHYCHTIHRKVVTFAICSVRTIRID
jgi:hypothetical protein